MIIASRRNVSTRCSMVLVVIVLVVINFYQAPLVSYGQSVGRDDTVGSVISQVESMITGLQSTNIDSSSEAFAVVKKWWSLNKQKVKQNSLEMTLEIDRQIANLSLALLNKDVQVAEDEAHTLLFSLKNYSDGAYMDNDGNQQMTLSAYVMKLRQAGDLMERQSWLEAQSAVKLLQRQWLSVEGDIVSQSQSVYNQAERDLVLLDAFLTNSDKQSQAKQVVERLINSLTPLMDAQYSWWDAALIPLREGIEALLVVGTLLMYTRRSESRSASRWVIIGLIGGIVVSIAVGFIVAILMTSSAFGHNNSLINGWTGVLASVLLLYVSYWLHRNSDAKRWNQFLKLKSSQALSNGRMISISLLAFFAIVREGLETVIFLFGMAGKMSTGELTAGIAAGFGILAICAFVMMKLGTRLPIKPVFLVSSIIVFYLCFKFMGSGIHSLQMAGVIPSTMHDYLPEAISLSLYPSWFSTLPQLLFVLLAVAIFIYQKTTTSLRVRK